MISKPTTVKQIDAWRRADSETEKLEFKEAKNQFDFDNLLAYCVAFANERGGVLLLGIANEPPRPVVGTKAFPNVVKIAHDIFNNLHFRVDVEAVQHPEGRVLVFRIPPRPIRHPYHLNGKYYMRSGESLVAMTPDQLKQIFNEQGPIFRVVLVSVFVILILSVIGFLSVKYWSATDTPTAVRSNLEQQSGSTMEPQNIPATGTNPKKRSGSTALKPKNSPAIGTVDWHDKHNWRRYLRVGMSRAEVHQLFGEAEKVRVYSDLEDWDYGSGNIEFAYGELYSWTEPDN